MLLRKDAAMLVKPVTTEEAERAKHWRVGTAIVLGRDGRILSRGR